MAAHSRAEQPAALCVWWQHLWMNERATCVSQATRHNGLERRQRNRNDVDRRRYMPVP
jgi:hypothetical protein